MLVAHFWSSLLNGLEALRLLRMLLEVAVRPVLFLAACKLSHTSLSQLVEIMATLTVSGVMTIEPTILQLLPMVNRMVRLLSSRLLSQCTMVARQRQATAELDRSNLSKLDMQAHSRMPGRQLSQCKDLFPASH
jgi:hypothetical protein